jgi:hypothetical protein
MLETSYSHVEWKCNALVVECKLLRGEERGRGTRA